MQVNKPIHLYSCGGTGDQILAFRLRLLLEQINKNIQVYNYCCCRDETWNMLRTIYPNIHFQRREEDWLNRTGIGDDYYVIYPDKLFRGRNSPPLRDWGITNFLVKQTRTLIGKWKPENRITVNLNSITPNYTFHSIPELVRELGKRFSDKEIYVPVLELWNQKELNIHNFNNLPSNVIIDINPEFSKSYDLLCRSEYLITTDSGIMHIAHDLNLPYLTLDPQYNRDAFLARWRPFGNYNSIPINALVEDIINVVKIQIEIPETQMIPVDRIFRQDKEWDKELLFKE